MSNFSFCFQFLSGKLGETHTACTNVSYMGHFAVYCACLLHGVTSTTSAWAGVTMDNSQVEK